MHAAGSLSEMHIYSKIEAVVINMVIHTTVFAIIIVSQATIAYFNNVYNNDDSTVMLDQIL